MASTDDYDAIIRNYDFRWAIIVKKPGLRFQLSSLTGNEEKEGLMMLSAVQNSLRIERLLNLIVSDLRLPIPYDCVTAMGAEITDYCHLCIMHTSVFQITAISFLHSIKSRIFYETASNQFLAEALCSVI